MEKSKYICDTNAVNFDMIFLDCVGCSSCGLLIVCLFKVSLKGQQGFAYTLTLTVNSFELCE